MNNHYPETLLEAYRQYFESKHHYDNLSWTIAAVVIVFVGVLLPVIPKIDVDHEALTIFTKVLAAGVDWSILLSINFLFFMRVFHAAISVSALISRAEAVISEQENFWPFSVKT